MDGRMPLSVTCQCGARLEIDEKFLGKEIPCPDCNRPLPTKPAAPPPLQLPKNRRMSGLAVMSLTLALIGFFIPPIALAAIGIGVWALHVIGQRPNKLEGIGYARAGMILGGVGVLVTTAALLSPTVFGIDVILRELAMTSSLDYVTTEGDIFSTQAQGDNVDIKRPSPSWGRYKSSMAANPNNAQQAEDVLMLLVNVPEDAYIACLSIDLAGDEKTEERQKKVLERLCKSEVINVVGRLRGTSFTAKDSIIESKPVPNSDKQEVLADIQLPRFDRKALIQFTTREPLKTSVMVGIARPSRFGQMEKTFRETFENIKFKN
jgi:hypothetical protein